MNLSVMDTSSVSFAFSAENPTGTHNGGTHARDCEKLRPCIEIAPGETAVLMDADGSGVIEHIWVTGCVVHNVILRMYWENSEFPSVEAPLSAFFGDAYDQNEVDSEGHYPVLNSALLLLSTGRSGNCYFDMPFRRHARITVTNTGVKPETLFYMIEGEYREVPGNCGYFHAEYHQEHPVQKGRAYTVIDGIEGEGKFIGLTFASGMNGNNTCWVEGEPKMYIDGGDYPTINYTGTEDYFCGSYGFGNDICIRKYQTYSGLYAGMYAILGNTDEQYNAQKRFLLYRWHVKDQIVFHKSFRMTMDNLGWTGARYDDYTSVAYWYQTVPSRLPYELPSESEMVMK